MKLAHAPALARIMNTTDYAHRDSAVQYWMNDTVSIVYTVDVRNGMNHQDIATEYDNIVNILADRGYVATVQNRTTNGIRIIVEGKQD